MVASPLRQKFCPRILRAVCAAALLAACGVSAGAAEAVKGEIRVVTDNGGFARLVLKLDEAVPASVRMNWPIVVITFGKPVDVSVDRLNGSAPNYISAARRDPDGTAIRIALARKLKISTIPAAERLYVDLLPDNWTGVLPGLPQDVVAELAQRARAADRILNRERAADRRQAPPMIRVKVASQPTFTRYVFSLPDSANAVPERSDGLLRLSFDQAIKWDLADALAALPPTLSAIKADPTKDRGTVDFVLNGAPEVRTFREDRSIVVDIGHDGAASKEGSEKNAELAVKADVPEGASHRAAAPAIAAPETVPADKAAVAAAADDGLPPLIDVPPPSAATTVKPVPPAPQQTQVQTAPAAPVEAAAPAPVPAPVLAPVLAPAPAPKLPAVARAAPPPAALPPISVPPSERKESAKPAKPQAAPSPPPDPNAPVKVELNRASDMLRLAFRFAAPTPAAAFVRADTLWLVFDTDAKIDLGALAAGDDKFIRNAVLERSADGAAIVRIKLKRPQLVSLDTAGSTWTVGIGDTVAVPVLPLAVARKAVGKNRVNIVIPLENPGKLHRIDDPDIGDRLLVVTALGPARGFLQPQHYVELRTLASTHGVVVHPIADDIAATLDGNKTVLSRPGGLSLSTAPIGEPEAASSPRSTAFDTQVWGFDRKAKFEERQAELIRRAAAAPANKRRQARFALARFYLARDLAAEARAVLDVALADHIGPEDVTGSVLRAIADVMLGRSEDALKELAKPQIGNQFEAPVWRAVAFARQGQWPEARAGFKAAATALAALPIELQRMAMMEALRANVSVRDFNGASQLVNEFETVGVPPDLAPAYAVLVGRLAEGLGRTEDALQSYRAAASSADRRAAAQGRLREIELRSATGDMPRKETITALETLTTVWRGDETETEGLKLLAHLYTEEGRYRDAFHVMRTALLAHPNSDLTRQIQDEAAASFDRLFLSDKVDVLPPIEALGLFYDYRELTPIGRRGDEMIRRLADRLVAVDLLDQAAELLQHQVDNRLQGAARAQVATRLAVIYLMNRKPERALATLRATRIAETANELRDQRLLLEARALSETGRHGLALEVIANISGQEAIRLRGDILWGAKRWREAAEQIELLHGKRWQQFTPLSEGERFDILRAAIGYSLAEEAIGLARFREKYAPKMAEGPDARAFEVVTAPIGPGSGEFQDVARRVANINTLDAFLRDMRARYPDTGAAPPAGVAKTVAPTPPKSDKPPAIPAKPAGGKSDTMPTGSIVRPPQPAPLGQAG